MRSGAGGALYISLLMKVGVGGASRKDLACMGPHGDNMGGSGIGGGFLCDEAQP